MELAETTAIITGSTGHLGGAIALALVGAGCKCVCHYHRKQKLAERLVELISDLGRDAVAVGADLTSSEQIERLFAASEKLGSAKILINSAAVFSRLPLADITFDEAQKTLNTNLIAPILVSRKFAAVVAAKSSDSPEPVGKIINIADIGGVRPWASYSLYCASKAGLIAATKSLAKELAPAICVNAVAPGLITWPDNMDETGKKRYLAGVPAGRIALASEVTSAIIFLLESDYITGQVLNIDGGKSI